MIEKNAQKYIQWKYRLVKNSGQANIQLGTEQVSIIVKKSTLLKRNLLYYAGAIGRVS